MPSTSISQMRGSLPKPTPGTKESGLAAATLLERISPSPIPLYRSSGDAVKLNPIQVFLNFRGTVRNIRRGVMAILRRA
jgi:hypothetical protein